MLAIMRRELGAFFSSIIGYAYLGVFYLATGLFFYAYLSSGSATADMSGIFGNMFMIILVFIPFLTMKLLSEEKKQKTDQALLTAPISLFSLVFGKFLATIIIYLLCIAVFLVLALVMAIFAPVSWVLIFGQFIGTFLMGATLITIGMFMSSLTENQVIAAISSLAISVALLLIDSFTSMISNPYIQLAVSKLSFSTHFTNFNSGVLDVADFIFFLSLMAVFIFLTMRVFEKRRWS